MSVITKINASFLSGWMLCACALDGAPIDRDDHERRFSRTKCIGSDDWLGCVSKSDDPGKVAELTSMASCAERYQGCWVAAGNGRRSPWTEPLYLRLLGVTPRSQ